MADVLARLPERFSLDDLRAFHDELGELFPQNQHIEAKVRQTLQILRDRGVLQFLERGHYRKLHVQPRFSCLLDTALGETYKSKSQQARAIIEPWAAFNLYCLECPSDDISALPNNSKVADFRCPSCDSAYQVKSSNGRFGNSVLGGDFKTYVQAAETRSFPNVLLVEWDPRFGCVFVVQGIHGASITQEQIIARNPLKESARRAGYRGCTISITGVPRIDLVAPQMRNPQECRADWQSMRALALSRP